MFTLLNDHGISVGLLPSVFYAVTADACFRLHMIFLKSTYDLNVSARVFDPQRLRGREVERQLNLSDFLAGEPTEFKFPLRDLVEAIFQRLVAFVSRRLGLLRNFLPINRGRRFFPDLFHCVGESLKEVFVFRLFCCRTFASLRFLRSLRGRFHRFIRLRLRLRSGKRLDQIGSIFRT